MDNPAEMWEALWNQLYKASMKPGCSLVLLKFTSFWQSGDDTITQYTTKLIIICKKQIGTTENITDDVLKTHIFTQSSNPYETNIQIYEQRILTPIEKQYKDGIR